MESSVLIQNSKVVTSENKVLPRLFGIFSIVFALITAFVDVGTVIACLISWYNGVEGDVDFLAHVIPLVLPCFSFVLFTASLGFSLSAMLVTIFSSFARIKSSGRKGCLISIATIMCVTAFNSLVIRGFNVFTSLVMVDGSTTMDYVPILIGSLLLTIILTLVCSAILCVLGAIATILCGRGWCAYTLSAIGLMLFPLISLLVFLALGLILMCLIAMALSLVILLLALGLKGIS